MSDHKILPFQPKGEAVSSEQHIQYCMEQTEISRQAVEAIDQIFLSYLNQRFGETEGPISQECMDKYYELCCATTTIFMARALTMLPVGKRQREIHLYAEKLKTFSDLLNEFSSTSFEETLQEALRKSRNKPE